MKKAIILLNGFARSGKDESYKIFEKLLGSHQCHRFAFADYLKDICVSLFNWDGLKDELGRRLLITVGQIMRDEIIYNNGYFKIDNNSYLPNKLFYKEHTILDIFYNLHKNFKAKKDFWINCVYEQIKDSNYLYNIITDFRFLNEYRFFFEKKEIYNLITINIKRDDSLKINDRSETELSNFDFDYYINNNGTLNDLEKEILLVIDKIEQKNI